MLPITVGEERKSAKPRKRWPNASLRTQDLRKRPLWWKERNPEGRKGAGEGAPDLTGSPGLRSPGKAIHTATFMPAYFEI